MKISLSVWPWIIAAVLVGLAIYSISGILLPFITGTFVAYAMHPAVTKMQEWKINRGLATLILIVGFFLILAGLLFFLIPFIKDELTKLAISLPNYGQRLMDTFLPYLDILNEYFGEDIGDLRSKATGYLGNMLSWGLRLLAGLLTNTLALANLISLIIITPIVAFYLLRDWPIILESVARLLPRQQAPIIDDLARKINATLGGYVRGQALVCLIQVFTYSFGLWLVGLDYAFTIGTVTGLLSFIPFVGMLIGVIAGLGVAFAQFDSWIHIGLVGLVFAAGNFFEGHVLAPNLVGGRIGLHPVWVIFALLAGGSLFGFIGMLLALPVAAALGVLVRFFASLYMESPLYQGEVSKSVKTRK